MSRDVLLCLLLSALMPTGGPLAAEIVAGHTAGQFQVNESGAATYTVPITAVPGTSGLEPKLALSYA